MLFFAVLLPLVLQSNHPHPILDGWQGLPYSQSRPYEFEFVSDLNAAFPQDRINCILKDSLGFLWAGTDRGLLRYDGSAIKWYRRNLDQPNSLSNEKIRVLYEDPWGFLWIGTQNGLNCLDRQSGTMTVWQGADQQQDSLPSMNIWTLQSDQHGRLWVGTEKGLAIGSPGSLTFESVPEFAGMAITALALDAWNQLWIGTETKGLFVSVAQDHSAWRPISNSKALSISSLLPLESQMLAGTWNCGLLSASLSGQHLTDDGYFESQSLKTVTALALDSQQVVWAGLEDRLVFRPPEKEAWTEVSASQVANSETLAIAAIFPAWDDLLWIATDRGGLHFTDLRARRFRYHLDEEFATLAFYQDREHQFWVGTTQGLAVYDQGQLTHRHLKDNQVHNIHQLEDHRLLAATSKGLFTVDPQTGEEVQVLKVPRLWRLLPRGDGAFWIASDSGLRLWHPEKGLLTHYQTSSSLEALSHDTISSLAIDARGRLWIGTFGGGLNLLEAQSGAITHFQYHPDLPNSISSNSVIDLQVDTAQNVWIATGDGGVNLLEPDSGQVTRWTMTEGLPDNTVASLAIDSQGILWLGTAEGLVRMDPIKGTFFTYSKSDGFLIGGIFSGSRWQDSSKRVLLFGGTGGAVAMDTQAFPPPPAPPLVFTEIFLDNRLLADFLLPSEGLSFPKPSKSMSLEIALLEFRPQPPAPYQFQREHIDDTLTPNRESRQVSYTGYLPLGGKGFLDVVATSHYLDPIKQRLHIEVGRPWWVAWLPFGGLLGLGLLIALIASILNLRHRKKQRLLEQKTQLAQSQQALAEARAGVAEKERRFQTEVTQILQQHLEQVSTELSNDVHDGPLGSVHALAFRLRDLETQVPAGQLKDTLGLLSQETLPALADRLRAICGELLKPDFSAGLEAELVNYLEVIKAQAPQLTIYFSFSSNAPDLPDALQATLYRIFRTLLKNLVKHAQARIAQIQVSADSQFLNLHLQDDGCGFHVPSSWQDFKENGHFGLYMAHYFANSAGGTFQVTSSPGHGTQFQISLPVTKGDTSETH